MSTDFRSGRNHRAPGAAGDINAASEDRVVGPIRRRQGVGPFITLIETERPDGLVARRESRRHRKQAPRASGAELDTWWAPRARGWWIAILFAVGSPCSPWALCPAT